MDNSFLQYIPLIKRGGSLFWPNGVVSALKALSRGPETSLVNSGESLCDFIFDVRQEIGIKNNLRRNAFEGYCLFFDDLISREESRNWFSEVVPFLARLLIRFPEILESHYKRNEAVNDCDTSLRILYPQQPGIIFLSQELVAALLACAFFSLFPTSHRWKKHLPPINFDSLFAALVMSSQNQEQKIRCIANYFQRVSSGIPTGVVSFERKVLPRKGGDFPFSYPSDASWSESKVSLCKFEVLEKGRIEDADKEVIEVDFANEYLGGGALSSGCVQEEIRFMINPELIAGMLFLPRMEDNESIEIVGAEQFSRYEGYASGFKFAGNFVDTRLQDNYGRRRVRILAIDALCFPGEKQYCFRMIRREVNKAYCGFLDHARFRNYSKSFNVSCSTEKHVEALHSRDEFEGTNKELCECNSNTLLKLDEEITSGSDSIDIAKLMSTPDGINGSSSKGVEERSTSLSTHCHTLGISTGNWGCGAFGGDVELKSILQWIAASQASRPFLIYHTFGESFGERLLKITEWIKSHDWTVGELWDMLIEYSKQRVEGKTRLPFFDWILPCVNGDATDLTLDVNALLGSAFNSIQISCDQLHDARKKFNTIISGLDFKCEEKNNMNQEVDTMMQKLEISNKEREEYLPEVHKLREELRLLKLKRPKEIGGASSQSSQASILASTGDPKKVLPSTTNPPTNAEQLRKELKEKMKLKNQITQLNKEKINLANLLEEVKGEQKELEYSLQNGMQMALLLEKYGADLFNEHPDLHNAHIIFTTNLEKYNPEFEET